MYSEDFESFKPIDFLELSRELYLQMNNFNSNSSALKRTIVSRTYYAAYLFVRDWFIQNKEKTEGETSHSLLPDLILTLEVPMEFARKDLRDKLLVLRKNRHKCDYYFEIPSSFSKNYNKYYTNSIEDLMEYSEELIDMFSNEEVK